ncbi:MAG: bifunctional proline dehydrogenase/L-glutamate gamma-semialdehyde dehydrogenase PutA [Pseudomonadota bacterium]|nr:bifunctional proline dehydrogenase/L-glutamate gamma-semialdehyde dehydrogenase PutA [Pseudomonadota bacterium]
MPASSPHPDTFRAAMTAAYREDEAAAVKRLLAAAAWRADLRARIRDRAYGLVEGVRGSKTRFTLLDSFLQQFGLSTQEGVALMCVAEALLRIPDKITADALIRDKVGEGAWEKYLGKSDTLFMNASTWALMLTGRVIEMGQDGANLLKRVVARVGEPVIRQAITQAVRILARQFLMGETIDEALKNARDDEKKGYTHSYDMLGEGARTQADADRYFRNYAEAIEAVGRARGSRGLFESPGVSIKLSALHPRYDIAQRDRVMAELVPPLLALAAKGKEAGITIIVDAEEADRWDISLDVIKAVFTDPALKGSEGFGLALQAYQKRAMASAEWLIALARQTGRRMPIRLVKGAYWDTEIKRGQERGLEGYPVFTRKISTDLSWLVCARRLLDARDAVFPMFATHNAHSIAAVLEMAGDSPAGFEFQRLYGMGEALHDQVTSIIPSRIYAPVGNHEDLLGYLVRRLLENGANSSFVNRIRDDSLSIDTIIADPVTAVEKLEMIPHPKITLPVDMFRPERQNSWGLDLSDPAVTGPLLKNMDSTGPWTAAPLIGGKPHTGTARPVRNPADLRQTTGTVEEASADLVEKTLDVALKAFPDWDRTPATERAACLDRAADLLEKHRTEFMALCVREGGKTIPDALAEVREAVDFCRYYAAQAREKLAEPALMPGPTGEKNTLSLRGRGVFVCISPWNFPLAIFMGQVTAALVSGNTVIAKPAAQTPLIAFHAVQILHEAGIPGDALAFLPGSGSTIGGRLVADNRIAGVAFTGSTETARRINQSLAARNGPIVPFIAETGGQNAMIVDTSALPEQVVDDLVTSAFRSAGQRCSAGRVAFLPEDTADKIITMLKGAVQELRVGNPGKLSTDVGPIIDKGALEGLQAHTKKLRDQGRQLLEAPLPDDCAHGTFLAPGAWLLDSLDDLKNEVFGPVLHVVRYPAGQLDPVLEAIRRTGYGLTLGIHSRIENTVRYIAERAPVGNIYVNRSMIGAVVGVQPFGGEGLSGTGPKAGGPHYLYRFCTERTLSVNTTAAGGNTSLVMMGA